MSMRETCCNTSPVHRPARGRQLLHRNPDPPEYQLRSHDYTFNGPGLTITGLILALQGRFARRGFVDASYTRAVSKDDSGALPIGNYPIEYSLSRFYGPSAWDAPNRFSLAWSYLLPSVNNGHGFLGESPPGGRPLPPRSCSRACPLPRPAALLSTLPGHRAAPSSSVLTAATSTPMVITTTSPM